MVRRWPEQAVWTHLVNKNKWADLRRFDDGSTRRTLKPAVNSRGRESMTRSTGICISLALSHF